MNSYLFSFLSLHYISQKKCIFRNSLLLVFFRRYIFKVSDTPLSCMIIYTNTLLSLSQKKMCDEMRCKLMINYEGKKEDIFFVHIVILFSCASSIFSIFSRRASREAFFLGLDINHVLFTLL